jgi:uncharacterized membrane protein YhhN
MGASAGFALAYFMSMALDAYTGLVAVKGAAVLLLAVVAWRQSGDINGRLLAAGLVLSSLGDVFLGIDRVGLFVQGLASFLVAHLFYVAVFVRLRPRPLALSARRKIAVAAVFIYGAGLAFWLAPDLDPHTAPVLIYAAAITAMGVSAMIAGFVKPWVALGAVLFIFSDSAIAIDKFLFAIDGVGYFIWPSYYLGQLLIMTGVIFALRQKQGQKDAAQ